MGLLAAIMKASGGRELGRIRSGIFAGQLLGMGLLQSTQQQVRHRMVAAEEKFQCEKLAGRADAVERAVGEYFGASFKVAVARNMKP